MGGSNISSRILVVRTEVVWEVLEARQQAGKNIHRHVSVRLSRSSDSRGRIQSSDLPTEQHTLQV